MTGYHALDDLPLVRLLQERDDEAAFKAIYDRYAPDLARFAGAKLWDPDDARDIVHDLFVQLWVARKQLKIDRDLKAYLFRLLRYRLVDKIRKNVRAENYQTMVQALSARYEASMEQYIEARELQGAIQRALHELSPRVKEIYLLSREEDQNITEIAQQLGLSEQTVKNQLTTALKHLRKSLPAVLLCLFLVYHTVYSELIIYFFK